jgi:hypothetical protein
MTFTELDGQHVFLVVQPGGLGAQVLLVTPPPDPEDAARFFANKQQTCFKAVKPSTQV